MLVVETTEISKVSENVIEVMKMWLLLFVSFGMTICLVVALAIFGLFNSDSKADEKGNKKNSKITSPMRPKSDTSSESRTPSPTATQIH